MLDVAAVPGMTLARRCGLAFVQLSFGPIALVLSGWLPRHVAWDVSVLPAVTLAALYGAALTALAGRSPGRGMARLVGCYASAGALMLLAAVVTVGNAVADVFILRDMELPYPSEVEARLVAAAALQAGIHLLVWLVAGVWLLLRWPGERTGPGTRGALARAVRMAPILQ